MEITAALIAVSVCLLGLAAVALVWATGQGQFGNLERDGIDALNDNTLDDDGESDA